MKARKFFVGMSAAALAMSLAVPALAANDLDNPNKTEFTGANPPQAQVNITLPAASSVVLNPYGISADIGTDPSTLSDAVSTAYIKTESTMSKVYSPTEIIINEGTTPLKVKATASGTVPTGSDVTIVSSNANLGDGDVYIYLEMADLGQAKEVSREATDASSNTVTVKDKELTAPTWKGTPMAVVVDSDTSVPSETDTQFTIKAAEEQFTTNPVTGAQVSAGVQPSYTGYHLAGDVGTPPDGAGEPWQKTDKVNVTIAFTFTPAAS